MRIIKTGCGNASEAFIEDRFTDSVNVIFSNDNNKGKTIVFQGMMYALGNDPIFPSGFDYKSYYFYTCIEHNGSIFEFLRKNNTLSIKQGENVTIIEHNAVKCCTSWQRPCKDQCPAERRGIFAIQWLLMLEMPLVHFRSVNRRGRNEQSPF